MKNFIKIRDTSFICFTSKWSYPSLNIQGKQLGVKMVKGTLSLFELYFTLMSSISVFVKSIQEDEFSNQITGTDDIKRDAAQRETFS